MGEITHSGGEAPCIHVGIPTAIVAFTNILGVITNILGLSHTLWGFAPCIHVVIPTSLVAFTNIMGEITHSGGEAPCIHVGIPTSLVAFRNILNISKLSLEIPPKHVSLHENYAKGKYFHRYYKPPGEIV